MIPTIPITWIICGVLALGVGGYVAHCEWTKSRMKEAAIVAEQQQRANAKQALEDRKAKERSDENYQRNMARLRADLQRLRERSSSLMPPASAGSQRPELACFDRAQLDAALRGYREGVLGLLGEGAAAVEGLDEARAWAKDK